MQSLRVMQSVLPVQMCGSVVAFLPKKHVDPELAVLFWHFDFLLITGSLSILSTINKTCMNPISVWNLHSAKGSYVIIHPHRCW